MCNLYQPARQPYEIGTCTRKSPCALIYESLSINQSANYYSHYWPCVSLWRYSAILLQLSDFTNMKIASKLNVHSTLFRKKYYQLSAANHYALSGQFIKVWRVRALSGWCAKNMLSVYKQCSFKDFPAMPSKKQVAVERVDKCFISFIPIVTVFHILVSQSLLVLVSETYMVWHEHVFKKLQAETECVWTFESNQFKNDLSEEIYCSSNSFAQIKYLQSEKSELD